MRSSVYYPHTQMNSPALMKSSLLLWDKVRTIVPYRGFEFDYGDRFAMAEAWELIGIPHVPTSSQHERAHMGIEETLRAGLPDRYKFREIVGQEHNRYSMWPQKLAPETWRMLRLHELTDARIFDGDHLLTQEGGLLIMSKLADACAGNTHARITDRLSAYGLIGSGGKRQADQTEVVPITLNLLDLSNVPMESLIRFRQREEEEGGDSLRRLRYLYADCIKEQINALSDAIDQSDRNEISRQFQSDMMMDLSDLQREMRWNPSSIVVNPVVVAAAAAGGYAYTHDLKGAALAALWPAIGSGPKLVADFITDRLSFNRKQVEVMRRHPMAYMYELSRNV